MPIIKKLHSQQEMRTANISRYFKMLDTGNELQNNQTEEKSGWRGRMATC